MVKKIISGILNAFFASIGISFLVLIVCYFMGIRPYIVLSGSMEPQIHTGSLVFVDTKYDFDKVEIGDIIAFEPKEGTLVTHRVINADNGLLETKGDNNEVSDGYTTHEDNFKGLTKFYLPQLGFLFAWIQTKRGMILAVTFVAAAIILDYALSDEEEKENKKRRNKKESQKEETEG